MRVIHDLEAAAFTDVILTIGNFDGVHRGHQAIFAAGRRRADAAGTPLVAMTFEPHPLAVLTPQHVPATLTPLPEKLRWLEHAGVDVVVVVPSGPDFLKLSPDDFIHRVIVERFAPAAIVEGASFAFGRGRQGNVETLRAAAASHGYEVEVVEPIRVALGGHPEPVVSSSLVRQLLTSGTVDHAGVCLGRPYVLVGTVTRGAGRGRSLGFPTVNVAASSQLIPAEGVYAVWVHYRNERFQGAMNIGKNPTFKNQALTLEVYILDFRKDIYSEELEVRFVKRIRGEKTFPSVEALVAQMHKDIAEVRTILTHS